MSYRVTDLSTNGPTDEETYRSYGMGQKYSNTSIMNINRIRIVGKELYIKGGQQSQHNFFILYSFSGQPWDNFPKI